MIIKFSLRGIRQVLREDVTLQSFEEGARGKKGVSL